MIYEWAQWVGENRGLINGAVPLALVLLLAWRFRQFRRGFRRGRRGE